jgi:hypothetical protein
LAGVTAVAGIAMFAMPAAASADESVRMTLKDTMGNNSGSSATATLTLDGDSVKVVIKGEGFTPKMPHAQHFHGSFTADKDFTCPTSAADKDGDGQVNTEEGLPQYGDVIISLTTSGDTSAKSGLALDRFPVADADGSLSYERTIKLPEGAGERMRNFHIVQHGLDANGNDKYDLEGLGESTFAKSLGVNGVPEEGTNPATCGTISGAAAGATPTGGVETGTGSTQGVESQGLLAAGGAALAGALVLFGARRRRAGSTS